MKRNLLVKVIVLIVCLATAFSLAACKKDKGPVDVVKEKGDTLVVGYSYFSNKFSPFFAKTAYDQDVAEMTNVVLLGTDRQGNMVLKGIEGETIKYNGIDYKYTGIADATVTQNQDATVKYDITIRDDIKFSDGTPMTIDDLIFTMYVLSDPSYDGSSSFYALPIAGMTEYRTGVSSDIYTKYSDIADKILAAGYENTTFADFTEAQQTTYWGEALNNAGIKFTQNIVDYVYREYANYSEADMGKYTDKDYVSRDDLKLGYAIAFWGYGEWTKDAEDNYDGKLKDAGNNIYDFVTTFPTIEGYWELIKDAYGYDLSDAGINRETTGEMNIRDLVKDEFISIEGPKDPNGGGAINNISGIVKNSDYSLTVNMTKFDATAIYQFNMLVAPLHYYGDKAEYNYAQNKFGFAKGDLSGVKSKTTVPLGAGAYKFKSFEQGVVTFEKNDLYFKGAPKTKYILFKETSDADKSTGVIGKTFDISDPNFNNETINAITTANGGTDLTGSKIITSAVDTLGYGYIGINAANVKVGTEIDSTASKNLRKAFATLIAVYRETSVGGYYGSRATVINYPISNTSWAAPQASDEGYAIAYSKDVNGNAIYTADMTAEQKFAAAKQAAKGFLNAAGYTFNEGTGKFTAAPSGAKMEYEIMIGGDGTGDHPSFAICTWVKAQLESIGLNLIINDPAQSTALWDALEAGTQELWCAAWQATPDPDMYQIYHSSNIVGEGNTDSNHYNIISDDLDELILDARKSADTAFRKSTYKQCLEIIMDWGVEIPVYQRQDCFIFNNERVDFNTVTKDMTTFWNWMNDIENIEMN